MEGIVVGNILGADVITLIDQSVNDIGYSAALQNTLLSEQIGDLTDESFVYREFNAQNDSDDNCILNYYQDGIRNTRNATLINLLNLVLDNDVYQHFRGELALGYIATSIVDVTENVIGINIIIQGSVETPDEMDQAIETFLADYVDILSALTEDDFQGLVSSLQGTLTQKVQTLEDEAESYLNKINDGTLDFNSRQEMLAVLPSLALTDLIQYYVNLFSIECKKLSIQIFSQVNMTALPTTMLSPSNLYCKTEPIPVFSVYNLDLPTYPLQ